MRKSIWMVVPFILCCFHAPAVNATASHPIVIDDPIFNQRLCLYESGKDLETTVLLVSGVGDDGSEVWADLIPRLGEQYHVIAFDLPGFGRSGTENRLYSPANYARLVKWIIDEFATGPVCLVGHSLGGAIALHYAGTYGDRLQCLVLVDAAGILHRVSYTKALLKNFRSADSGGPVENVKPFSMGDYFVQTVMEDMDYAFVPDDIWRFLEDESFRRVVLRGDPHMITGLALVSTDFSEVIDNVKVPVFILWGEDDPIAPVRTGRALASRIPGAGLHVMEGTGHNPMLDRPGEFRGLLLGCLRVEPFEAEKKRLPLPPGRNVARIVNEDNVVLTGHYDLIHVEDSDHVRIVDVSARHINIVNSTVSIENSVIQSEGIGIRVLDSILVATGIKVRAYVGFVTANSRLDLAGVEVEGDKAAVLSAEQSTVVFSVCKAKSPHNDRTIHGIVKLNKNNPL